MKYIEYEEQQMKQVSELPIKYAFGKEQFNLGVDNVARVCYYNSVKRQRRKPK